MNVSGYSSKITSYYLYQPKFIATVEETIQPVVDLNNFESSLPQAFDIDFAIGAQLDIVGQWVNLTRNVQVPVPDPWFRWGDNWRGWGKGYWREPLDFAATLEKLGDEDYRRLLKARIYANQWDGTAASARAILLSFFNGTDYTVVVDDKDTMECYYGLSGAWPDKVILELFRGSYLPLAGAGIRTYHYVTSVNNTPLFGWGVNNSAIGGWGSGAWGIDPLTIIVTPQG